ncbi:MAG: serine O-acetyltransferase [Methylovirgula sp.]|uniref:serine O-acetyltransferase n=1 Tax=Methylovirgula sp. TaxID=1978224 RepID=UPI003076765F
MSSVKSSLASASCDRPDSIFARIRREAEELLRRDLSIAPWVTTIILEQPSFEAAVIYRAASRLGNDTIAVEQIRQTYSDIAARDPSIGVVFRADLLAFLDRDPCCERLIEPLLYFKGFHALATHRLAHALWTEGRYDFALYLQSRSSEVFQTDIHPAAKIGKGIFLDHATGLVVGSTAVVEDNVSLLQDVTLGGTGKEAGDRHPKIRHGVLIGAGAKVLGNIEVGHCARIATGSVVLRPVPPKTTVAGVPAQIVGDAGCPEPALSMDQILAAKAAARG